MSEVIFKKNEPLPKGWKFSTFENITKNHDGKRIPVSAKLRKGMKGKYPYYGASGIIDHVDRPLFKGKYLLIGEDGANLLSRTTPIAFIVNGDFWVNNHAHILTTLADIPLEFLSYFINSINLSTWISGTAQPKLNQTNMNKIPVPIPPLNEQKRIVNKINDIFLELDNLKKILKKIKLQSEQQIQSLLKSTFENKDWKNVRLGDYLTLEYGKGLSKKDRNNGSIPVYGSSGIVGYHDKILVKNPSLIIGRKGNAGNIMFSKQSFWAIDTTYFLKETKDYDLKFLYHLFKYLDFGKLDSSTAIPSLRRDDVYAQNIPLPEIEKQKEIVLQIEERFFFIKNNENIVNLILKQVDTLRSSVLKQAFEGKLIPQDPNDESAEIILQKIKLEKKLLIQKSSREKKNVK